MTHEPASPSSYHVLQQQGISEMSVWCMYAEVHAWDVQVVSVGLEEEMCPVVDYDECLTPAERLLPLLRQPKPGEPQVQHFFMCHAPPPLPTQIPVCTLMCHYQSLNDTSQLSECRHLVGCSGVLRLLQLVLASWHRRR